MYYLILILTIFLSSCGGGGGGKSSCIGDNCSSSSSSGSSGLLFNDDIVINDTVKTIFFLVSFEDRNIQSSNDIWAKKIFGKEPGQLNHYYNEVSNGKFQLIPALNNGIIAVTYDAPTPDLSYDNLTIIKDTLKSVLIAADDLIDFASFDDNHNQAISRDELQIIFILAGIEQATSSEGVILAHAYSLNDNFALDDVKLMQKNYGAGYSVFAERHITLNHNHDATIGVIAHELGHSLFNLPDLYDISYKSTGISSFGLMGFGSWNYVSGQPPGARPAHPLAYSKIKSGFITPTILTSTTKNLEVNTKKFNAYKIFISNPTEYFLLENHHSSQYYDQGLIYLINGQNYDIKGGLLITHINENNAKLVDVEEANEEEANQEELNLKNIGAKIKHLFFMGNKDNFNSTTRPSTNDDNGNTTGIDISNISLPNRVMTFDVTL